ncbi:MAG: hypothetical protein KDD35_07440 [Bdellovibrionales bacterium]|nr:hypothetical protein [Bdellovibrionales bacterium]
MNINRKGMGRVKRLSVSLLTVLIGFFFPICVSVAGSKQSLPPGDYIFNSKSGDYEPFFPESERTVTDFVSDCDNSPGLQRNADQFGFIKTALMGKDGRCSLEYSESNKSKDSKLFGVGGFFALDGPCKKEDGKTCTGTGHLVLDQDLVITAAHVFQLPGTDVPVDFRSFRFVAKVWIPKQLRKDPNIAYEPRIYEIEDVHFGRADAGKSDTKDYAFVKLKERVGEFIGSGVYSANKSKKIRVSEGKWIKPLPFTKLFDSEKFNKPASTVGFHFDKSDAQKNCEPNQMFKHPEIPGLVVFNGDTLGGASGSAVAVPDRNNILTFAAIFTGQSIPYSQTEFEGDFDLARRYNYGIDGNEIYDEFMRYRKQKLGRTSLAPKWQSGK